MFAKQFLIFIAVAGFAMTGAVAAEHDHKHGHASEPAGLTLDDGKKWPIDEPVRKGMKNIRDLMQASLHGIHEGKLTDAGYNELAKKIIGEVNTIVAGCKLEPKTDAQMHIVIGEVLAGAETMEGKPGKTKRQDGAISVINALGKYGAHFDHPGWKQVEH